MEAVFWELFSFIGHWIYWKSVVYSVDDTFTKPPIHRQIQQITTLSSYNTATYAIFQKMEFYTLEFRDKSYVKVYPDGTGASNKRTAIHTVQGTGTVHNFRLFIADF